mmetsp:Transcript_34265/g.55449  ORF Transcript_34265/g.55449 Transcript_34265/m.55449 type:complete len:473 (+) Transcript_34265:2050-3468(+)
MATVSSTNVQQIPWADNYQLLESVDSWNQVLKPSPFIHSFDTNTADDNNGKTNMTPTIARSKAFVTDYWKRPKKAVPPPKPEPATPCVNCKCSCCQASTSPPTPSPPSAPSTPTPSGEAPVVAPSAPAPVEYEVADIPAFSTDILGVNGSVQFFYTVVTDSQEFSDAVSNIATLSGSYGGLSGSLSVDFARSTNQKMFHTHAFVGVFMEDYVVQVPLVYVNQLKLVDEAKNLLKKGNTPAERLENFSKVYGDSFIVGYVTGGQFVADLDYATSSSAEQSALKAELTVSYKNAFLEVGVSAGFKKDTQSSEAKTSCTVMITSMGFPTDEAMVVVDLASLIAAVGTFTEYDGSAKCHAVLYKYANLPAVRNELAKNAPLSFNTPNEVVLSFFRSEQYKHEYNLKLIQDLHGKPDHEEIKAKLEDLEASTLAALTDILSKKPADTRTPESWKQFYKDHRLADSLNKQILALFDPK